MILSNNSAVTDWTSLPARSLMIGAMANEHNYFAIRVDQRASGYARATQSLAILTRLPHRELGPYLVGPDVFGRSSKACLDLGAAWSIDVEVTAYAPSFNRLPNALLAFSSGRFFLVLKDGQYVDLNNGEVIDGLLDRPKTVWWKQFSIAVPQPNGRADQKYSFENSSKTESEDHD